MCVWRKEKAYTLANGCSSSCSVTVTLKADAGRIITAARKMDCEETIACAAF